jgi:hypothetical protein
MNHGKMRTGVVTCQTGVVTCQTGVVTCQTGVVTCQTGGHMSKRRDRLYVVFICVTCQWSPFSGSQPSS